MKKILSFMILLAGVISITSCGDDNFAYNAAEPIEIETSDVVFDAVGGEGYIQVNEAGAITAETTSSWLQIAVEGQRVKVTASVNTSLSGRSASIVLKSGSKTSTVTATQTGAVLKTDAPESIIYDDKAHTVSYSFTCSIPVTLSTSASWLKAEQADGKLAIAMAENNSGQIRTANISYKAGSFEGKIEVTQGDIDKDVVGKYYVLGGNDPDAEDPDDAEVSFLTAITKDGDQYNLVFPQFGWSMPVTFSKEDLTMTVSAGQSMGAYATYNVFSLIGDAAEGYITWNPSVTMTASIKQYTETDEDGTYSYVAGEFKDDGKWDGHASDVFSLGAFSSETPSNNGFVGTLAFFTDVAIIEYDIENMSAGKKAPKAISAVKAKVMPMTLKNKYTVVK